MTYKTPGVYVKEIATFPPSVVPVETAIPAFVGYTEMSRDSDGSSLNMVPTRITSLLEFETYFGGDFRPANYVVKFVANAVESVQPKDASNNDRRYYLYNCLRHYYANGGGACYIVAVGSYSTAPALGNTTTPSGLQGGLMLLERLDEPTLLLFPDGVSLTAADLGSLQVAALTQCEKLQDRFVIMDLREGHLATSLTIDPVGDFRQAVGTSNLKYGASYYPWVNTIYQPDVQFRKLLLVDGTATPLSDETLNTLTGDIVIDALVPTVRTTDANVTTVVGAVNISAMEGPNLLVLNRENFSQLNTHFADLLELLRQTPNTPVATVRQRFSNLLLLARSSALALRTLEAATLPAVLTQAVAAVRADPDLVTAILRLVALEKNTDVLGSVSTTRTAGDVDTDYAAMNGTAWIAPKATISVIAANTSNFAGANQRETALKATAELQQTFEKIEAAVLAVFSAAEFLAGQAEKQLFDKHSVYRDVAEQVKRNMSLLPVGGAVAGVYAAVDRARGVWKAPANVSLADVSGPAVKINDAGQADLNVSTSGKSVNAVRAFAGKGTLIWGARTLAGNDNEWRYVPVRRFFNMAEESIKKATEPFVFEPNDANTWVRVRAMIENFLTVQWRQGALAGATTTQAFYVKLGLGETMTAQDILEGRMIVEVGMAVVRPAEFIILKFAHKMQVS